MGLLRHLAWLLVLWAASATASSQLPPGEIYRFAGTPAWVEVTKPQYGAPSTSGELSGGTWLLLFDRQINIRSDGDDEYMHLAVKVENPDGVKEQSQINIEVDPVYQRLELHSLRVVRDGKAIDCRKTTRITILAVEKELERHIYNGAYNVNLLLSDIRPGDIVEYDYTIHSHEWLMLGHFSRRMAVGWSDPVLWQRVRLRYPAQRQLKYRFSSKPINPEKRIDGDHMEMSFLWEHLPAMPADKDRPGWVVPWPVLEVSDISDWASIANSIAGLFTLDERPRPNLEAALASLRDSPGSPEQQVMRTLRYVQANIRYTSISIGRGSFAPSDPETTLERRFGDCKDKALLLATLLRRQGIAAAPVLVNSRRGKILPEVLPSPYLFDHAIVRARLGNADFWLDGTSYPQWSPLADLAPPNFAWTLPIAADTTALERIPAPGANSTGREVRVNFDFSKGLHEPATMEVVTRYTGDAADSIRSELGRQSDSERQTRYLNYYARFYPGIRDAAPVSVTNDTATNILEIHEHYTLDKGFAAKDDGKETFLARTDELYHYAETLKSSVRSSPLAVDYPDHVRQIITVHMPDEWKVKDEITQIDDPAFKYRSRVSNKGSTVTLDYDYQALSDHVDVADIARYQADRSRLSDDLDFRFSHTPTASQEDNEPEASLAIAPQPLLTGLIALAIGIWLMYRYAYPYDPPARLAPAGTPSGIGGWLLLPALRSVAGPLILLLAIGQFARFADASLWQTLPKIVSKPYSGWAQPVMLILIALGGLLLPFSVTVGLLFFRKRTSAPALFIWLLIGLALYDLLVVSMGAASGIKDAGSEKDIVRSLFSGIFYVAIWGTYMAQSARVKATFTKRLRPSPPPLPDPLPVNGEASAPTGEV